MKVVRQINLPRLAGPPEAYQTYAVSRPRATHFRPATCQEAECPNYLRGWTTTIDVGTDLGQRQASYIRLRSGRAFSTTEAGTVITFTFPPGQRCFSQHTAPLDREPDFRIGVRPVRFGDWMDDFGENQERVRERLAREGG